MPSLPRASSIALVGCALSSLSACTSWTSLHAGYGQALGSDRSVAGVEVRKAAGLGLHKPYALIGARLDGGDRQVDAEAHVGVMHPLRLGTAWTIVPSATVEFARVSYVADRWDGGALGPGLGSELLWWFSSRSGRHRSTGSFGCMGGAPGVDCPYSCYDDYARTGLGLRVSAEYDVRFGSSGHPGLGDSILWFTLGLSRASGSEDTDCGPIEEPFFGIRRRHP